MSVLAVGLGHRSASPRVLEAASEGVRDRAKVLGELLSGEHVAEAVLLATCNRVEVYAHTTTFHGGLAEVAGLLSRASGWPMEELRDVLYVHHDARAVQHLFSVASGLDSMLVGEAQILGQLREAFAAAQAEGSVGRGLGELFRTALRVGKRVHSETGIDRAGASLVDEALRLAADRLGGLAGRPALLVGAGATAGLAGRALRAAGVGELAVVNRTPDRARRLAGTLGADRWGGLDALPGELARADLTVSATTSTGVVVPAPALAAAASARAGRPQIVVDLALPRDVEPAPGAEVIDLEQLGAVLADRPAVLDVEAAAGIVAEEVAAFASWQRASEVSPTVVALRAKADEVVAAELDRLAARVPELGPRASAEVERTVHRVVDKLLHAPTVRVKELAGSPGGDGYAQALRELFELDPNTAEALSAPEELPEWDR